MARKAAAVTTRRNAPQQDPPESLDPADEDKSEVDDAVEGDLVADADISDNIGEQSVEINVENLIAELEAESHRGRSRDVHCARRKLEDYLERKRVAHDIEDFEDFEIED